MTEQMRPEWAAHTARSSRAASVTQANDQALRAPGFNTTTTGPTPIKASVRTEVLRDAERAINGERDQAYGAPAVNFTRIARMWSVLLEGKLKDGVRIDPGDVAAMQIALKLARSMTSPGKRDHWVDAAGYAALAAEINQEPS